MYLFCWQKFTAVPVTQFLATNPLLVPATVRYVPFLLAEIYYLVLVTQFLP